jgi:hypothetical protein
MPYHNPKHKTRSQRQRRRTGRVRRLEVTLSADSERDHDISDYLDSLPPGSAAEFIRQAIAEKMQRENDPAVAPAPPVPEAAPASASTQIDQLFAELDHQRRDAQQQIETLYQELADEKRRAGQQLETMITELVELRSELRQQQRQPVGFPVPMPPDTPTGAPPVPPTLPEAPETVRSAGIDMSRPRPRKQPARTPTAASPAPLEELSEQDAIRLAKIMANSIKRAQPGRG